ncbi:MAG TPA: hypothetical protein VNN10_02130 [Dehalococcoidia bacterium]|nr:hypothetical protein [Dehalococcoidia bacterium]
MPRIVLDFEPPNADAPQLAGDTSDLAYFLSWAFSARYGGNHEMSVASLILRGEFKIDLRPLLTFADREVETEADADMLEKAWQEPGPLADCCDRVVQAFDSGEKRLSALTEEYPDLVRQIGELGQIARWAANAGLRIRVTFSMEPLT